MLFALAAIVLAACSSGTSAPDTGASEFEEGTPRMALIIGNARYRGLAKLDNPENDAKLMGETFRELGFRLQGGRVHLNLSATQMRREIERYRSFVETQGGIGAIYFAGHAVQVDGVNWLAPVDANPTNREEFREQFISAEAIFGKDNKGGINLVILDACRDNPYESVPGARTAEMEFLRGASPGLTSVVAPPDTLVAFATAPGTVALDGRGANSPYAEALSKALVDPNRRIEDIFIRARANVAAATGAQQIPWETSSLTAKITLKPSVLPSETDLPADVDIKDVLATRRQETLYCSRASDVYERTPGLGCRAIRQLPDGTFEHTAYSPSRIFPSCARVHLFGDLSVYDARQGIFDYANVFFQFSDGNLLEIDQDTGEREILYATQNCVVDEHCFRAVSRDLMNFSWYGHSSRGGYVHSSCRGMPLRYTSAEE